MTKRKKSILWILGILVTIAAIVFISRFYILDQIKLKLEAKLHDLKKTGLEVTYDSIGIDWKRNVITIENISIRKNGYDTTCIYPEFISAQLIKANGFRILPWLLRDHFSFEIVDVISPHVVLHEGSEFFTDSATRKGSEFTVLVDQVNIPSAHIEYADSSSCKPIFAHRSSGGIKELILRFYEDRGPVFHFLSLQLDSVIMHMPTVFYTLTVKKTKLDLDLGIFDLDTLKIIPHYDKLEFGRNKGYEVDRLEGLVPYVNLSGLSLRYQDTLAVVAKTATTQVFLRVFRDKRLPFKDKYTVLPIEQLRDLPFGIDIKTLVLNKSYVEYEEFVDGADSSGHIFFDNLFATISNINNMSYSDEGETKLIAKAAFMGQGDLQVKASLPWKPTRRYTVNGTLMDFDIPRINAVLEPIVQIRAESGRMNNLAFHFNYNTKHSDGEIELDYNDLKLMTFKEIESPKKNKKRNKNHDDEHGVKKDALKSFMLNTFIIRKNMDDKIPEEKRTGTIKFNRDTSRSIFNYWWKSLLTGIKSAYKLDKIDDRKLKKQLKKKEKK